MTAGRIAKFLCVTGLLGLATAPARAQFVADKSDPLGDSSFHSTAPNSVGYVSMWTDDGGVTHEYPDTTPGGTYTTNDFRMRTPDDDLSYTFDGQLIVNNTNGREGGLMYKGAGTTGVITINDLVLAGGHIAHQNTNNAHVFQLAGNINVTAPSTLDAKQGDINVLAAIGGAANLTIAATDAPGETAERFVNLLGNNSFTGSINVIGKMRLENAGALTFNIGASGVNNNITGTGIGQFAGTFNFNLTGASTTPGSSWTITNVATQSYDPNTFSVGGDFSRSGDFWTNGTYLFNPLTGTLSVATPPTAWDVDGGGDWNLGANWAGDVAPGTGADVAFGSSLTAPNAPANINLNVPASVTRISFSNANQYRLTGANTLTLTGLAQLSSTSGTHEVGVVVAGNAGLTKVGSGGVVLSANNTYTGTTNVQGGTLLLRHVGAVDGAANVDAGATLMFDGDPNASGLGYSGTFTGNITGAGQVATSTTLTTETVTFNTAKAYTGQTTVNGGTLLITGTGTPGVSDGTAASRTLVDGNQSTGKLALSGNIAIGNELLVLEARELAALNSVHLTSSGNNSWAGNIKGEAGGTQYNIESTSGTLTLSGTISAPAANARNFVFDGAGNVNITGDLTDLETDATGVLLPGPVNANNNVNVVKRGTGTLTIGTASTSANDYWLGTTTVEAGTLQVLSDGANNGELRSSTISVGAGATLDVDNFSNYSVQSTQDLNGGGDIHAQTVSIFGDSLLSPGDNGAGTMTLRGNGGAGNASLYIGSDFFDAPGARGGLVFDLAGVTTIGSGVNDLITGVQNLTFDIQQYSDTFTPLGTDSPIEILVNLVDNQLAGGGAGSYRLINYSGSLTPIANTAAPLYSVQLQGVGQIRQNVAISTTTPGQVNLVVTGAVGNQTWTGASSDDWNINSATNWSGASNVYFNLDNVTFNDSAGANDTVEITENVLPGSITFNSATSNTYTLTGAGGITGGANVALTGNVTAVVANNATNTVGDVALAAATTLQHGNGTSTGSTFINGVVSGAGALHVNSGQLQLSGANTYSGVTTVNGGTLLIDNVDALGTTAGNTVVNGGTLRSNGDTFTVSEPIALNGGAFAVGGGDPAALIVGSNITVGANGGTIQVDGGTGADGLTVNGNLVGSSAGALNANVDGGSTMTVTGNITNNGTLNKNGAGVLALTGTASITSPMINVNNGTLSLSGLSSTFTLASGQTLNNNSNNTVVGNVVAGNGSTVSGAGTFANTVAAQSGSTVRVGGVGLPSISNEFLIDDFESYAVGDVVNVASPPWTSHNAALTADIETEVGDNQVLSFGLAAGLGGVSRSMPTNAVISQGEVATVFYRFNPRTDDPDHSFGVGDVAETAAVNFANFEAQVAARLGASAGNFELVVRNGGGLTVVNPSLPINTWYNIWLVIDTNTDTYDVYMNTGTGDATGANLVADNFGFRNGASTNPLNFLLGMGNTAPVDNGVRYDDVYYLNGVNLNNPLSGLNPGSFFEAQTMTVQGDLSLAAGVTTQFDISTPSVLDSLAITGNLAAGGLLDVDLQPGSPAPALGNVFDLFDFATSSGSFSSYSLPPLASGLAWSVADLMTAGELEVVADVDLDNDGDVDGFDFLIIQRTNPSLIPAWDALYGTQILTPLSAAVTTVPEPSTLVAALSALVATLSLRRKR